VKPSVFLLDGAMKGIPPLNLAPKPLVRKIKEATR